MARRRGSRDFFDHGDPFTGFGGFGDPRSLLSNFFEKDPFDDPFFTRPFGSMFGGSMFGHSMFGPGMLGSDMLGPSIFGPGMVGSGMLGHNIFAAGDSPSRHAPNFLEHQDPQCNKSKGVVIKELSSDDEGEEDKGTEEEEEDKGTKEKKDNRRKHSRLGKEPFVQYPDDEAEERKRKHPHYMRDYDRGNRVQPRTETFSFQSSSVTYGGANGNYYTKSTTRRAGGDGVMVEESKEADATSGRATHRVSRGIHDKGHSVTRKLESDGKVDTVQMLHNLNADELAGFEEKWRGNARKHFPGWNHDMLESANLGGGGEDRQNGQPLRGWALPSTEAPQDPQRTTSYANSTPNSFNRKA